MLDREEYIEQVYFFRTLRERMEENLPTQEILDHVHEEILSITRLPLAIQFLATEIKHTGCLSSGFDRLGHYFTPFQAFVIRQTEENRNRFSIETGLMVLEREAQHRANQPSQAAAFVYQFEALSRNRLGYDAGLTAMEADPIYDQAWREFVVLVRRQLGAVEFADLVYLRSEWYVIEQRRHNATYEPPVPPLFAEKEGKIAKANRGRDPLYLFAALQRQLNYPEVPRPKPRDDLRSQLLSMQAKIRELEARIKLTEGELRGQVDLSEYMKTEPPVEDDE